MTFERLGLGQGVAFWKSLGFRNIFFYSHLHAPSSYSLKDGDHRRLGGDCWVSGKLMVFLFCTYCSWVLFLYFFYCSTVIRKGHGIKGVSLCFLPPLPGTTGCAGLPHGKVCDSVEGSEIFGVLLLCISQEALGIGKHTAKECHKDPPGDNCRNGVFLGKETVHWRKVWVSAMFNS